jgi:hypothetical protein
MGYNLEDWQVNIHISWNAFNGTDNRLNPFNDKNNYKFQKHKKTYCHSFPLNKTKNAEGFCL